MHQPVRDDVFTGPVALFTSIGKATRRGARLALLVRQDAHDNEWFTTVGEALGGAAPPAPTARDLEPFSLADPDTTSDILTAAGFDDVEFAPVHEPAYYGPDPDAAYDAVLRLQHARDLLASVDPAAAWRAAERLRAMLAAHRSDDGVVFDSRAWIITAHRL